MKADLIIYHRDCPDGFCAAFIAKKKFPDATLLGTTYGEQPPLEKLVGLALDVLVVDYSWKREQMLAVAELTHSIRVIDHHKTAQAELAGLDFATFDMTRSGAGLTWDILFAEPRPWYVNYVEDRDLWNWKLPDSKTVSSFIMTLPHTVEAWSVLDSMIANDAIQLGRGAEMHVRYYIEKIVAQKQIGRFNGYKTAVVNAPYTNISDVCNELCQQGAEIGLGWFERGDGMLQFSLRSIGDLDVAEIAKEYGGGGHKNASGFQVSQTRGRMILDAILAKRFSSYTG